VLRVAWHEPQVIAPEPGGWHAPLARFAAAVDARTRVVAVSHVSYLTAEETIQLRDEMRRLLNRYEERLNPELRPAGALPVEWMLFAAPIPEWADAAGPDPATGPGALDAAASDNPDDTGGE